MIIRLGKIQGKPYGGEASPLYARGLNSRDETWHFSGFSSSVCFFLYLFLYFFGICLVFFHFLISNYNVLSLFLKLEEERLCLLKYWLKYTPSFPTVESALLFLPYLVKKSSTVLKFRGCYIQRIWKTSVLQCSFQYIYSTKSSFIKTLLR